MTEEKEQAAHPSGAQSAEVRAELEAMKTIAKVLDGLPGPEPRSRVLNWAASVYRPQGGANLEVGATVRPQRPRAGVREIPGIATMSESGEFHLTIRDPKARSANDAAVRILHVVCLAHEQLTGDGRVSSKGVVVPILRRFRAYDGNTRAILAKHRGIMREGDSVSLDSFCKQEAEAYVREILDPTVQGKWKPLASVARRPAQDTKTPH